MVTGFVSWACMSLTVSLSGQFLAPMAYGAHEWTLRIEKPGGLKS